MAMGTFLAPTFPPRGSSSSSERCSVLSCATERASAQSATSSSAPRNERSGAAVLPPICTPTAPGAPGWSEPTTGASYTTAPSSTSRTTRLSKTSASLRQALPGTRRAPVR